MTPEEERAFTKRRDARNVVLAVVLALLAVLFYYVTIARMKH